MNVSRVWALLLALLVLFPAKAYAGYLSWEQTGGLLHGVWAWERLRWVWGLMGG